MYAFASYRAARRDYNTLRRLNGGLDPLLELIVSTPVLTQQHIIAAQLCLTMVGITTILVGSTQVSPLILATRLAISIAAILLANKSRIQRRQRIAIFELIHQRKLTDAPAKGQN
jgi:hypothetical protein